MSKVNFQNMVPVLETKRLILRAHCNDDFVHFAAMREDPIIAKYTTGKPIPEDEAWTKFLTCLGVWGMVGYGYWAIENKSTGEFVGEAGFAEFKRDISPSIKGFPEIGWVIASKFHCQGFATEAVAAAVAWGDKTFKDPRTVCIIDPGNAPSIRIAEKNGYKEFTKTEFKESDLIIFERFRDQ